MAITDQMIDQAYSDLVKHSTHSSSSIAPDVSRGSWKKNGALHSVIRVSDQAATSACSRTSLRRW